ncbi:hypothetical protein JRQ81_020008, partial [Phrynocephalus forsythii]
MAALGRPPDVMLVHLGGNDITSQMGKSLAQDIVWDLERWKVAFPETILVWSTIVPRQQWRACCDPQIINRSRRGVNRDVCKAMVQRLGIVVGHPRICAARAELYRGDGVHLSDQGMELFLSDLKRGLQQV